MSFYVYELSDPRTGEPFYVGKGKGKRIDNHEVEARKGGGSVKCQMIRDIWADGYGVRKRIIRYFRSEKAAYDFERERIAQIGLENLTNVTPGGATPSWLDVNKSIKGDALMVLSFARMWAASKGMAQTIFFRLCGERFEIPQTIIEVGKAKSEAIIQRRGIEWANALMERNGRSVRFHSEQGSNNALG